MAIRASGDGPGWFPTALSVRSPGLKSRFEEIDPSEEGRPRRRHSGSRPTVPGRGPTDCAQRSRKPRIRLSIPVGR
jgi:hypothetical protein